MASTRGAAGGYQLQRSPDQITLADVWRSEAYDAFRGKLVAYNRRYAPAHVPELLLNTPPRLALRPARIADHAYDPRWNKYILRRITGHFTGTTDEIFQWAAAKWGLPDNDNHVGLIIPISISDKIAELLVRIGKYSCLQEFAVKNNSVR